MQHVMACAPQHLFWLQTVNVQDTPAEGKGRAAAAATFQTFLQFLQELSSADSAGRVLLTKTGGMFLNPDCGRTSSISTHALFPNPSGTYQSLTDSSNQIRKWGK